MKTLILAAMVATAVPAAAQADPHLWLEDVTGAKALEWVKARNAKYLPELESAPQFKAWQARAEEILQDPRRIAYPTGANPSGVTRDKVFNFWRDPKNVRGLWRVSPRAAYDAGKPEWTTLLDMDALEAAEGKNFQFSGANCLPPAYRRCLVGLSVGGKDAVEIREFDLGTKQFVAGGFRLGEAKQTIAWLDENRLRPLGRRRRRAMRARCGCGSAAPISRRRS
jgi:prolyl oligopeptidase